MANHASAAAAGVTLVTELDGNLGPRMQEIDEGLWHWTASHPRINWEVSSYYLSDERVLIDPVLPAAGLEWFRGIDSLPAHVLLSCRHHDRASWQFVEAFGTEVHCVDTGVHELQGRGPVTPFAFGDELPGGVIAHEVDSISPDETALYIPAHRALVCADGVMRSDQESALQFVPDGLMDDPEQTKAGLRVAFTKLLELDFDRLLLAHGQPIIVGGKQALAGFVGE
jgi:glyoxylase-like metal-dependent hydrolase (beta-lactamase superfamily II)